MSTGINGNIQIPELNPASKNLAARLQKLKAQ
jgi:hypothetical protein